MKRTQRILTHEEIEHEAHLSRLYGQDDGDIAGVTITNGHVGEDDPGYWQSQEQEQDFRSIVDGMQAAPPPPGVVLTSTSSGKSYRRGEDPGAVKQVNSVAPAKRRLALRKVGAVGAANIQPRQWAYGKFLQFGQPSMLVAVDGGGKGFKVVGYSIAMITGCPVLGEHVYRSGPVVIISYEDDEEEWHRRFSAACEFHKRRFPEIDYEHVMDNIHFLYVGEGAERITFGSRGPREGSIISDADEIADLAKDVGAVLIIVDPFNHAHGMEDGNSNPIIAKVAGEVVKAAKMSGAAVLMLHHVRKGSTGIADDAMGATSLRATFRKTRVLARMDKKTADEMNLTDHWRYIRLAGSKENYAPPPGEGVWFKLESVDLGNTFDPTYPEGDSVAVMTTYSMRPTFEGMDHNALSAVFAELARNPYSDAKQAGPKWAGKVIMSAGDRSEVEAKKILKAWIEEGTLIRDTFINEQKNSVTRLVPDPIKVAQIIGNMTAPFDDLD